MNKTVVSHRSHPFFSDMILVMFVYCSFLPWSCAFVGINNASKSCPAVPNIAVGFPLLFVGILQAIVAGIGTSNFLRAALIVSLNSSSFGSIKNILLNCPTLSSFGFLIAHLCLAFFFAASDMCVHISGHTSSEREGVCFLVSLLPDHVYSSGGFLFNKVNLVKFVSAFDNFLSPSTFQ